MSTMFYALTDAAAIAKRNVIKIKRVPEVLVFVLLSPIMFVLLFVYVFGGSINIPGGSYREFLIAGIFAQTVVFGSIFTGAGLAEDIQKGIMNRFRSLPMSRSALLVGRTVSDVMYNAASLAIMALTGLVVGWRIDTGVLQGVAGFALLLLFAYAFSWIMAYIGLLVPSVEVINNASFMVTMPLTFVANTFVPAENLPPGAAHVRALESGVRGHPGDAGAVREHSSGHARPDYLAAAASGALHPDLGGGHHRRVRPAGGAPLPHHPARLTVWLALSGSGLGTTMQPMRTTPNILSPVLEMTLYEPVPGFTAELTAEEPA